MKAEALWGEVLAPVVDDRMVGSILDFLDVLPLSFYKAPASYTGQYHAPDERGPGGLALHSWRMAKIMPAMTTMSNYLPVAPMLVAAIVHDAWKPDLGRSGYHWHPRKSANMVWDHWGVPIEHDDYRAIAAVACLKHEGRWTDMRCLPEMPIPWQDIDARLPDVARVMHAADFVLSRAVLATIFKPEIGQDFLRRLNELFGDFPHPGITKDGEDSR